MLTTIVAAVASLAVIAAGAAASAGSFSFRSIEGGEIDVADLRGGPVLIVNTASMCGFTYQYAGLQSLYDDYRDRGLTVLAVPSDAFNQEYASDEEVKDFCEVNYGVTLPMTEITEVRGAGAHPFYAWLRDAHGFEPRWNFNKVLLDADGAFVDAWGSSVRPSSALMRKPIERIIAGGS